MTGRFISVRVMEGSAKTSSIVRFMSSGRSTGSRRQLTTALACLRQGVLGVAPGEHGGDTGGAHLGVVKGNGGEAGYGAGIVRILHHGLDVGAELSTVDSAPRSKSARVTSKSLTGKSNLPRRASPLAR